MRTNPRKHSENATTDLCEVVGKNGPTPLAGNPTRIREQIKSRIYIWRPPTFSTVIRIDFWLGLYRMFTESTITCVTLQYTTNPPYHPPPSPSSHPIFVVRSRATALGAFSPRPRLPRRTTSSPKRGQGTEFVLRFQRGQRRVCHVGCEGTPTIPLFNTLIYFPPMRVGAFSRYRTRGVSSNAQATPEVCNTASHNRERGAALYDIVFHRL